MRRSLATSLVLTWCIAALSQTTAGYSRPERPEHRGNQGPALPPPGGAFRLLRPLLSFVGHHPPHKRQALPTRPQHQQQPINHQLNIPAIGFRRRQHEQHHQRGGGGGGPGGSPFTHQFPRQQQPQTFPRPLRPQPQQQRRFQHQQLNSWQQKPTPAAARPTFKPTSQKSSQKRLDDPFPKGFVNFGNEFSKHFPQLPGSFESNFGYKAPASFHSPAGGNDEYNEQAPTGGESQDYEEPASNQHQDEPASPDYEDPSTGSTPSRHPEPFGYPSPPQEAFRRPSANEPSDGPSHYTGPQTNYEDDNSNDYGTSLAEEAEGEGEGDNNSQSQNDEEETEGPSYNRPAIRPQYNSYRPTSTPNGYNYAPEEEEDDSQLYNNRPQYGGYQRPSAGSPGSGEGDSSVDDGPDVMYEPPSKGHFRRPSPNYNQQPASSYNNADHDDDDTPQYARPRPQQQYRIPSDASDDSGDDDGYGSSKGSYPHVGQSYKPPKPYYQAPEETREDDEPETSYRTSEAADAGHSTANDDEESIASVKPEPFFRPNRPSNQQGRPNKQRESTVANDDEEAENDSDGSPGSGPASYNGPRQQKNKLYDETSPPEYDDRRRRVSSEPVYANANGAYPNNVPQQPKFNQKRRPLFGRIRSQMASSRIDLTPKIAPVKAESPQQTPVDRMDNNQEKPEEESEPEGRESKSEPEVVQAASSKPLTSSKRDFQSQRARLEALRQKFKTKANQRLTVQSREAPEESGSEINVQQIMAAAGQDHKPYENIGGYIEDDPNSPRRIDKNESEAEFHSRLVDTKQSKDSRIRKLLRKRTQPPVTPQEMNAQSA